MGRNAQRVAFRRRVFAVNPFCHWCDERMILEPEPHEIELMATIEHLTPKSKGGSDGETNLRLVHKKCNK